MKRYILSLTIGMISFLNGFSAQTGDAFKGVWPVTDKSIQKSLNGEWQLKVIKGSVPTILCLKQTPVRLTKGSHKLYIKALDDHIIVDISVSG